MADKIIKFYHGASSGIQGKIDDGTINESDIVITSDTDEIVYIDETKTQKPLGSSKSKQEWEVQLGSGGTVGGLKTGDTIPEGTTMDELIKLLTQKSVPATYVQPGVTCRVSTGTSAGSYEVGTEINTTLQGIFTQNDAGALTTIEILKNGSSILSQAASPITTEAQTFTLGEETVSFTAKATYADGQIKNDNLGQPSPDGQIKAGSKTSSAVSFTGKRNLFYGTGVGTAPTVTSELVRGLSNKQLGPSNGTSFNINVAAGQQYVVIAYPATLRKITKCFYVGQNTDLAENFTEQTISVQGANGAAGADYRVLVYQMAVPAAASMTLQVQI
jgi:hypothetical protein